MKKLLSFILTVAMLCLAVVVVFADEMPANTSEKNVQKYEYVLPIEYTRIDRLQNCYIVYDKQEKCAIYSLNGEKLSDDYDYKFKRYITK